MGIYVKNYKDIGWETHCFDLTKFPLPFSDKNTYHTVGLGAKKSDLRTRYDSTMEIREYFNEEILQLAREDITKKVFGLKDPSILGKKITLLTVPEGSVLTNEGDYNAALYFVVKGCLAVIQADENNHELLVYYCQPGMVSGQLAVLTGEPSMFSVKATCESIVVRILKTDLFSMLREHAEEASNIILNIGHSITSRMSPFIRQIDFALDWINVESGQTLFRQSDKAEASYIILNGRLRSVIETNEHKKYIDVEYGRGDIIGLSENIRGSKRPNSVHAVRDTELARIPDGLLTLIRHKYPSVTTRIAGFLGNVIHKERKLLDTHETDNTYGDMTNLLTNLSTVAIMPSNNFVALESFSRQLESSVGQICSTIRLTSEKIRKRLGNAAFDTYEWQLTSHLGTMEEVNRLVLYQCDYEMTPWTRRCLRQADAILIVARADQKPSVGALEQELEHMQGLGRSLKMLILLHPEQTVRPQKTAKWLNLRGWLTTHFHIKAPDIYFSKSSRPEKRVRRKSGRDNMSRTTSYNDNTDDKNIISSPRKNLHDSDSTSSGGNSPSKHFVCNDGSKYSDFGRLARFLTGTSVALVFGGGGARGISQIGILKTLIEQGVPIDMVGGTSIGSYNSAIWAKTRNVQQTENLIETFSRSMSSIWNKILEITYPHTSFFSGRIFGGEIEKILETDQTIEDLWIPYFCISTDLRVDAMKNFFL